MKRFSLDVLLFFLMLGTALHKLSGDRIHEWLSVLLAVLILWHLLLNWNLIFGVGRRFFSAMVSGRAKFNFVWNILLYTTMGIVMLSGLLISRSVLPTLGIGIENDPFMSYIHKRSIFILYMMLGVHFGMHWDWFKAQFRTKKEAEG